MDTRRRTIKVWTILVMAMTVTCGLLFALQTEKGSSTLFSLSGYYVNSAYPLDVLRISSSATPFKWRGISVEYSSTESGGIEELAAKQSLTSSDLLNCHFVISNGFFEGAFDSSLDGFIEATVRWQNQSPCIEESYWQDTGSIRILVVGTESLSEMQEHSLLNLVQGLQVNYGIADDRVDYRVSK